MPKAAIEQMPAMSDDDVWAAEGEDAGSPRQLDREWAARREQHWNRGYLEGVEAGKQETVQAGFNEGKRSCCCLLSMLAGISASAISVLNAHSRRCRLCRRRTGGPSVGCGLRRRRRSGSLRSQGPSSPDS